MIHSKAAFARLAGVGRSAITHAIRSGRLTVNADGEIDDEHPLAVAYLARRRISAPAHGTHGRGRPVVNGNVPPDPELAQLLAELDADRFFEQLAAEADGFFAQLLAELDADGFFEQLAGGLKADEFFDQPLDEILAAAIAPEGEP